MAITNSSSTTAVMNPATSTAASPNSAAVASLSGSPSNRITPPTDHNSTSNSNRLRSFSRGSFDAFHCPEVQIYRDSHHNRPRKLSDLPEPFDPSPPLEGIPSRKNSTDNYIPVGSRKGSQRNSFSDHFSLGGIGFPVLKITRTSSSARPSHNKLEEIDPATFEQLQDRRPSQVIDDETPPPSSPSGRKPSITKFHIRDAETGPDAAAISCDPETCKHHHHRRSSISSTISITCSDEETDETDNMPERSEEHTIPLKPYTVPLFRASWCAELEGDRCAEMSRLLTHPGQKNWVDQMIYHLGRPVYDKELVQLWTTVSRQEMPDREWLRKTREMLTWYTDGASNHEWEEFKEVVGWPGDDNNLLEFTHESSGRRGSTGDLPSPTMNAIVEEEEDSEPEVKPKSPPKSSEPESKSESKPEFKPNPLPSNFLDVSALGKKKKNVSR